MLILSTINPIWAGLESSPDLRVERPVFFVIEGREYLEELSK